MRSSGIGSGIGGGAGAAKANDSGSKLKFTFRSSVANSGLGSDPASASLG